MQEFDKIGEDLFNKIRGRFPSITIGNEESEVINDPSQARFFDFEYKDIGFNLNSNYSQESLTIVFCSDNFWILFESRIKFFS